MGPGWRLGSQDTALLYQVTVNSCYTSSVQLGGGGERERVDPQFPAWGHFLDQGLIGKLFLPGFSIIGSHPVWPQLREITFGFKGMFLVD